MTVGELIKQAFIMNGMQSPTDDTDADLQQYGWDKLYDLIDLMKTNRLMMYRRQRVGPFTVLSGQGDITAAAPITIGSGATWDTPRPVWIDYAGVIYTAGGTPRPELPMRVFTVKEWKEITVKGITSTLSRALIYDQDYSAAGYGAIYLYPVPSASFQVVLYVPQAIDQFPLNEDDVPDYTTVIAMPPGYRPFLISNLAMIVGLGVTPISDDLKNHAERTLHAVMASNVVQHMDPLSCEDAVLQTDNRGVPFNWINGNIN
jgi:hypothetical protein